jgi:hypothetical protein
MSIKPNPLDVLKDVHEKALYDKSLKAKALYDHLFLNSRDHLTDQYFNDIKGKSIRTLSDELNCSSKTIRCAIYELEKAKCLEVIRGTRIKSNAFRFVFEYKNAPVKKVGLDILLISPDKAVPMGTHNKGGVPIGTHLKPQGVPIGTHLDPEAVPIGTRNNIYNNIYIDENIREIEKLLITQLEARLKELNFFDFQKFTRSNEKTPFIEEDDETRLRFIDYVSKKHFNEGRGGAVIRAKITDFEEYKKFKRQEEAQAEKNTILALCASIKDGSEMFNQKGQKGIFRVIRDWKGEVQGYEITGLKKADGRESSFRIRTVADLNYWKVKEPGQKTA